MKIKLKLSILILIALISSCKNEIEFELPFNTESVIVNSTFSPKKNIELSVEYSRGPEENVFTPIANLEISLFEDGILIEKITQTNDLKYQSSIIPEAGKTYRIEFEHNGNLIWAEDRVPNNVNLDSVIVYDPILGTSYYAERYLIPLTVFTNDVSSMNENYWFKLNGVFFNAGEHIFLDENDNIIVSDTGKFTGNDITNMIDNLGLLDYNFPEYENSFNALIDGISINYGDTFQYNSKGYLTNYSNNYSEFQEFLSQQYQDQIWMEIGSIIEPIYGFESNVFGEGAFGTFFAFNGDSIPINYRRNN